mgnify:CR=1 FL=1
MNSVTPIWPAVFLGMYLFLELLDWGLSLAAPFVARNQEENKAVLSLLKPGIDLNEAWLIFGLSLVASAVPAAAGDTMHDSVMAVLSVAVVGGALRILAAFFKNVFGSALIMKGMSLYSALALFVIGLSGGSMVTGGDLMSGVGIVISLWLILAAFELAALYGAVKIMNPLGERCRAAFLVSSILQLLFFHGIPAERGHRRRSVLRPLLDRPCRIVRFEHRRLRPRPHAPHDGRFGCTVYCDLLLRQSVCGRDFVQTAGCIDAGSHGHGGYHRMDYRCSPVASLSEESGL